MTMKRGSPGTSTQEAKRTKKCVQFSTEAPVEIVDRKCHNEKEDELRWYSRKHYTDFMQDRIQTVRLYRSLGGKEELLEPHYSIRGLEMYKSASLNCEIQSHRVMHHQTVLREQTRLKNKGVQDPMRIASQVSHMSNWALKRAQEIALHDAYEAGYIQEKPTMSMQSSPTRRASLSSSIDLEKLRAMNAQLIQNHMKSITASGTTTDNSLHALMRASRRYSIEHAGVHTDPVLSNTNVVSPLQYTPLRRDSLHGLSRLQNA